MTRLPAGFAGAVHEPAAVKGTPRAPEAGRPDAPARESLAADLFGTVSLKLKRKIKARTRPSGTRP